ncbi:hypothetical protein PAPYR_12988 [Paratrimastix pyriformis]|uniref:Uncharacterized protein n=1 Tax=Paratrimastix pyriformis TaxID=342808 RepID=A0ABQ8U110_9EUKA|nr:hypothetical protein PAPYR_12988 [Paratrimastix pyriformis]
MRSSPSPSTRAGGRAASRVKALASRVAKTRAPSKLHHRPVCCPSQTSASPLSYTILPPAQPHMIHPPGPCDADQVDPRPSAASRAFLPAAVVSQLVRCPPAPASRQPPPPPPRRPASRHCGLTAYAELTLPASFWPAQVAPRVALRPLALRDGVPSSASFRPSPAVARPSPAPRPGVPAAQPPATPFGEQKPQSGQTRSHRRQGRSNRHLALLPPPPRRSRGRSAAASANPFAVGAPALCQAPRTQPRKDAANPFAPKPTAAQAAGPAPRPDADKDKAKPSPFGAPPPQAEAITVRPCGSAGGEASSSSIALCHPSREALALRGGGTGGGGREALALRHRPAAPAEKPRPSAPLLWEASPFAAAGLWPEAKPSPFGAPAFISFRRPCPCCRPAASSEKPPPPPAAAEKSASPSPLLPPSTNHPLRCPVAPAAPAADKARPSPFGGAPAATAPDAGKPSSPLPPAVGPAPPEKPSPLGGPSCPAIRGDLPCSEPSRPAAAPRSASPRRALDTAAPATALPPAIPAPASPAPAAPFLRPPPLRRRHQHSTSTGTSTGTSTRGGANPLPPSRPSTRCLAVPGCPTAAPPCRPPSRRPSAHPRPPSRSIFWGPGLDTGSIFGAPSSGPAASISRGRPQQLPQQCPREPVSTGPRRLDLQGPYCYCRRRVGLCGPGHTLPYQPGSAFGMAALGGLSSMGLMGASGFGSSAFGSAAPAFGSAAPAFGGAPAFGSAAPAFGSAARPSAATAGSIFGAPAAAAAPSSIFGPQGGAQWQVRK